MYNYEMVNLYLTNISESKGKQFVIMQLERNESLDQAQTTVLWLRLARAD